MAANRTTRWVALLVPALPVAITLATVFESMRRGRLSGAPTSDNVIYMAGGARLFAAFESGGVGGMVRAYMQHSPHSPYAEVLACLSFVVFGVRDAAPSLASVLVPLLGLGWCLRLARGAPLSVAALLLVAVAAVPIWTWSIEVFKPDYFASLTTAVAVTILLGRPAKSSRRSSLMLAGVMLGLAIWSKPTFLPATLAYSGAAFLLGRFMAGSRRPARSFVRSAVMVAAPAVIIAGPHLCLVWKTESEYFWRQFAGASAESWRFHGTLWQHFTYYLTGPSGSVLLGRGLWPLGGSILLVAGAVCWRFSFAAVRRGFPWFLCLLLSFAIPTVARMKVTEFACTFDFLLLFAFVRSIATLARVRRRAFPGFPVALAASALAAAGCIALFRWTIPLSPILLQNSSRPTLPEQAIVARDVFDAVERAAGGRPTSVLILGPRGVINHNLFAYWSVRDRNHLSTSLVRKALSEADLANRLSAVDILVASDGSTSMTEPESEAGLSRHLLEHITANREWNECARVSVPGTEGHFFVFARQPPNRTSP